MQIGDRQLFSNVYGWVWEACFGRHEYGDDSLIICHEFGVLFGCFGREGILEIPDAYALLLISSPMVALRRRVFRVRGSL